ncbi:casein kinase II, regulatory subunit [Tribonema minus]|uniref:Casein kinase II subunit beta n=1 Tax=Tribonema minus TaxID=303371 RepID=A0A835ZJS8_9STRA|nr:casein kinase II, regulatory subunit [Tribonema minus]
MSETSSTGDGEDSWVQWFCSLQGHEMFCEVDRSYIEDGFNLYGLRQYVPNITECLDIILDRVGPEDSDEDLLQSSYMLYGLIHARYIITTNGLEAMRKKHAMQDFGCCPRMLCRASAVVPIGMRDEPKLEGVKLFCPSCQDVYAPWAPSSPQAQLDGAYFGTTFAHLFCMTYEITAPTAKELYVPRIFGFRIHREASSTDTRQRRRRRQHLFHYFCAL